MLHSHRRMEVTRDLHNLNLLAKLMVLLHQILFHLATAGITEAILMQISAEQVSSLHRVAPKYLKLITSSNFQPFMLVSMLLVMILLFSVLILPFPLLSKSLLVRS